MKEHEMRQEESKQRHESDQMLKGLVTMQMDLMKQMMAMMQGGFLPKPPPPPGV
jgi:hypothetical protein